MHAGNYIIRLALYFFLAFSLVGCDGEPPLSSSENIEQKPKPALTFIVHPYDNPSELVERFSPLCDYLGSQLGQPIKLVVARSYVDQIHRITSEQADFAYIGPTPFLRAQDHYLKDNEQKLIPLAAEVRSGKMSYKSVLVVRADSTIQSVEEIAGHTLALGAPHSFGSHYVPRILLGNAGLSFADLRDYAYLGRHERVALAVLHGDFDAGGLSQSVALQYIDRHPRLRILATSPPLPPHLIVARPGLNKNLVNRLRHALVKSGEIDDEYKKALFALAPETGFTAPQMDDFDRARRVITALESKPATLSSW